MMRFTNLVNRYFYKLNTGLSKQQTVGAPVSFTGSDYQLGVIESYNPKNGYALIRLNADVNYADLVRGGIPLEHIRFGKEIN